MLGKRCIKVLRLKYMLKEYETVLYYVEICCSSSLNSFMFTSIFHQIVVSTIVFENCAQHYYLLWESKETKWKLTEKQRHLYFPVKVRLLKTMVVSLQEAGPISWPDIRLRTISSQFWHFSKISFILVKVNWFSKTIMFIFDICTTTRIHLFYYW